MKPNISRVLVCSLGFLVPRGYANALLYPTYDFSEDSLRYLGDLHPFLVVWQQVYSPVVLLYPLVVFLDLPVPLQLGVSHRYYPTSATKAKSDYLLEQRSYIRNIEPVWCFCSPLWRIDRSPINARVLTDAVASIWVQLF